MSTAASHGSESATAIRLEQAVDGILEVVFDAPGSRVNLLSTAVLEELRGVLDEVAARSDARAILFTSGKPGQFIAGADVREIQAVRDAAEGRAKAAQGQAIFERIAALRVATCAAIDGPCMGGGLELALACRYRIVSDNSRTSLALPEVRLGILPAFGGTTRLPRLIGLVAALPMLLTGKALDARGASRVGLADDVVPAEDFRGRARSVLGQWLRREEQLRLSTPLSPADAARVTRRRVPPSGQLALVQGNPFGRSLILGRASKEVLAETKGRYPAPPRIVEVLSRGLAAPVAESLRLEAEAAGDLLVSPECRNLAALFFLTERAKREPVAARAHAVARVGVLGAGVMGGGIAALFARAGVRVRLKDVAHEPIGRALATAWDLFDRERARRRIDTRERDRRMRRISGTLDYSGFRRVDVVVEAIVEDLAIKQRVLAEVEQMIPESAVLATNTSSLRLEDLAQGLANPQRLVGLHFFNPVHRMPLAEVVVGEQTSLEARDTVLALARAAGKTPVVVKSSPGFLVNRILMRYAEEALRLFEAGVPIDQLDQSMVEFGMPMGPLALLDEIGLDVALKVSAVFERAFATETDRPQVLRPMVEGGRLGKKSGLGFYRHGKDRREPDPAVYTLVTRPSGSTVQLGTEGWTERLVLAMVNEAARCLEERVVEGPEDVDVAMILGTGFPPFRGGLLRYADSLGLARVVERLHALGEATGPRFAPARILREAAAQGRPLRTDVPS